MSPSGKADFNTVDGRNRLGHELSHIASQARGEVAGSGYLDPNTVRQLLQCAGIPMVPELVSTSKEELTLFAERVGFPVVAKVVGPIHKSDVGGVTLNIRTQEHLSMEFDRMMQIPDATAVMVQKMMKGTELFIGAKYEERFGHVVLCGLGGRSAEGRAERSGAAELQRSLLNDPLTARL